ncbi:CapA family protein [Natrialbaceae archaeon GCM10025810]|uniref:CapA family protein n=1 Tax=Halovalidus salilacus TaxID=3075124 RepID=UPI00361AF85A
MTVRIGFAGDVMLGRLVDRRQERRAVDAVWGDLLERLRGLDGLIVNLECCLSTRGEPWTRTDRPFHFRADPDWTIPALERAGVDVCALANNHVLDYEEVALEDTLERLDEAGIERAGAGRSLDEALEPAVISLTGGGTAAGGEDLAVAVVSFTDNTPEYAADENSPGTARIEIDVENEGTRALVRESLERAREALSTSDADSSLLVASLHWGPNMVERPPDSFREFGRWLVEEGVGVVHGHSAHVPQGIEVHEGRPICYDAGDFVDDYAVDSRLRNDRSFLFTLVVEGGDPRELRLTPTEIDDCRVLEADPEAAEWSRERVRELSGEFGTEFEREGEELVVDLGLE